MGLMDELKRLTQPYDDDDDFNEDADESFMSSGHPQEPQQSNISSAQAQFEDAFADDYYDEPQPAKKPKASKAPRTSGAGGSIFGNLGDNRKVQEAPRQQSVKPSKKKISGVDQQVVLFNPKSFDEAGELVTYVSQGRSLVMALEGIPTETARRLLDFISGICFAMNAKITPVSAKTYFITPENVDLLDAQALQSGSAQQDDF